MYIYTNSTVIVVIIHAVNIGDDAEICWGHHLALGLEGGQLGEGVQAGAFQVVPGGLGLARALGRALEEAQRLQRLARRQVRPRRIEAPQSLERRPLQPSKHFSPVPRRLSTFRQSPWL